MLGFLILLLFITVMVLDLKDKINLNKMFFTAIWLLVLPHIVLIMVGIANSQISLASRVLIIISILMFFFYVVIRISIAPGRVNDSLTMRLFVLKGGRKLIEYSIYCEIVQIVLYSVILHKYGIEIMKINFMILDMVVVILFILCMLSNGMIRILISSKWLSVIKRVVCILFMWTPIINLIVLKYFCHVAYTEYEYETYKVGNKNARVDSDVCATKYPIVLIHGVGFRDARYFNYWGRIPAELKKQGAEIYYGNQEGWGTIEYNAQNLKNKIETIIQDTGCNKVNIIAHSKGGLDSRYMISKLGMSPYVASLTTISTPHRGVKMVDILIKMPKGLFNVVAKIVNSIFHKYGDENPDFKGAVYAFATKASEEFNANVFDMPDVYYQSYMSVLKNVFSDYILSLPYIFIKLIDGENDGLVTIDSSKWGEFEGVFRNQYRRGISHGDMIDLKREDYRGFDVVERYVEIVAELRGKGF